jgi:hypothetical protein
VSNTAALGASVTAKGDASRIAARVYAYPTSGGGSANYALDAMRVESSAYDSINPPASSPSSTGSSTQHGATANGSTFRDPVFWTSPSYLNFGSTAWNFSTVASRGYPTLANVEVP